MCSGKYAARPVRKGRSDHTWQDHGAGVGVLECKPVAMVFCSDTFSDREVVAAVLVLCARSPCPALFVDSTS